MKIKQGKISSFFISSGFNFAQIEHQRYIDCTNSANTKELFHEKSYRSLFSLLKKLYTFQKKAHIYM